MHAIRHHAFGPPDVLVLEDLPDLEPAAGEVRIAVEASGVHLLDTTLRRGEAGGPLPPADLPTVPGREVAGVVDAVGGGVDGSWVGRRVVAHLGMVPGGYAEQAVTTVGTLFAVPDDVSFPDAVAAVGTGRTALGVVELEPVGPGDTVLVLSAAGGLGWLLAQSAVAAGADVVAAARGVERTRALADLGGEVVDYGRPGWDEAVRERGGVTVVYDGVGGELGRTALELLRPGGRHVMFGYAAGEPTRFDTRDVVERGLTVGWSLGPRMMALPDGIPGLARRALARVAAGEWRPLVTTYPLAEAARAHADLEGRRALGKVVLVAGGRDHR
ncbi:zinc-binding dehydrogenase [Nocardioides lijunqiniae]|uniref:zinc-binding dehydrogenase n=1 Tax=Nocardioides lijunqiniae TaxID=2760832 RepID=UPI001878EBFB|nr:zinc-binding dehydrogenase [Nocardioides lijunqiniae]